MPGRSKQRILRALHALASTGWTVARARSELLEIPDDAYPQIAVDQKHFDEPFGDDGELMDDLHLVRHGPRPDIQVAFARQRLCVALTDDEHEDFRALRSPRLVRPEVRALSPVARVRRLPADGAGSPRRDRGRP
jgi:hypothetical protein